MFYRLFEEGKGMKRSTLLAPLFCTVILAACGGGGGGDSFPEYASTITSSNARDVAAQGYSSFEALNDQSSSGGNMILSAQVDGQSTKPGLLDTSLNLLYRGLPSQTLANLAADIAATGTDTETFGCSGGGTITYRIDFSNPNQLSDGDRLTITANNCIENGVALNGKVAYTFSDMNGTIGSSSAWSATLALQYSNFSVAYDGEAVRTNGDLTMTYSQDGFGTESANVRGSSLQVTVLENNTVVVDRHLKSYALSEEVNGSNTTYSADYTLSGNFPEIGNATYTVDTVTPFQAVVGSRPSTGVLTVTATDGTSLRLTALDTVNVRLEIDTNGDGAINETIDTTWADLESRM